MAESADALASGCVTTVNLLDNPFLGIFLLFFRKSSLIFLSLYGIIK